LLYVAVGSIGGARLDLFKARRGRVLAAGLQEETRARLHTLLRLDAVLWAVVMIVVKMSWVSQSGHKAQLPVRVHNPSTKIRRAS
jgi:hypothetical protein